MSSPPKPWERPGAAASSAAATATSIAPTMVPTSQPTSTTIDSTTSPAIPERPATLASTVNQTAAAYSRVNNAPYGAYGNAYGSAYSTPYSNPYSRYGGYGGGYGGGMYGSGMYGGGMYGGGMYGSGMPGMQGDPNDPNSLTSRFNNGTQATFQMLEGVVGAFGGFAQMLESTYYTTHSSFFAIVAIAEQFGNLRETLGSVLGIFTLMRWIRTAIAKLTGRPPPADASALTPAAFARFEGRNLPNPDGTPAPPRPSKKPLMFFLLAAFGLPYVMSKIIKSLAASHEEEEKRRMALLQQQQQVDPSKLEFCRVQYDFTPEQGVATVQGVDLAVKMGDFVAVLSRSDPLGNPSEWWQCRARDGRVGYLPSNFLEVARRPGQPVAAIKAAPGSDSSRANSLTSYITGVNGGEQQQQPVPVPVMPQSKVGDISAESFIKTGFYS